MYPTSTIVATITADRLRQVATARAARATSLRAAPPHASRPMAAPSSGLSFRSGPIQMTRTDSDALRTPRRRRRRYGSCSVLRFSTSSIRRAPAGASRGGASEA